MGNLRDSGHTPPGHTPPERTPLDPTPVRAASPGRRDEMSSDAKITTRIERPPVDLTPPPLPPSPAAADAAQWLARARARADSAEPAPPAPSVDLTAPVAQAGAPPWLFPLLLAATALVVGMVLGALLFGRRASCPPQGAGHGSTSPTSSSRAAEVTALYSAIDRRSV